MIVEPVPFLDGDLDLDSLLYYENSLKAETDFDISEWASDTSDYLGRLI